MKATVLRMLCFFIILECAATNLQFTLFVALTIVYCIDPMSG